MSTLKLPLEGRGLSNRRRPLIRHRGQVSTSCYSLDSVFHNSLSLETARNSCSRHKSQMLPPFSASPSSLEPASFDLVLVASSRPPPRILLSFSCCLCPLVTGTCPRFSLFFFSSPKAALSGLCWVLPDFLFFFLERSGTCPAKNDVIDECETISSSRTKSEAIAPLSFWLSTQSWSYMVLLISTPREFKYIVIIVINPQSCVLSCFGEFLLRS